MVIASLVIWISLLVEFREAIEYRVGDVIDGPVGRPNHRYFLSLEHDGNDCVRKSVGLAGITWSDYRE